MEIERGIFLVGGPDHSHPKDACAYLMDGRERAVLIDAGAGDGVTKIAENIARAGVELGKVQYLVLTHCHVDHSGGAPGFQAQGVKIVAHQRCAEILAPGGDPRTAADWYGMRLPPINVDVAFEGNEHRIDLGGEDLVCIHIPGHSPGSICAYIDRDGRRVLFGQDVHGPLHPVLESNREQYQQSLKAMLALDADVLCEGHFGIYRPREAVKKYISSYL
jgi:glyoxylase-like metal-dependent hydrolase (beta-lactamase superfamily II)